MATAATSRGHPTRHRSSIRRIASDYHEYSTIDFEAEAQVALSELQSTYGTAALEKRDVASLMDGWNKILGWETMWKEGFAENTSGKGGAPEAIQ
jgi:hypothetical protein